MVARLAIDQAERACSTATARRLTGATEAAAVAERGFLVDEYHWVDEQRAAVEDVAVRATLVRAEAQLLLGLSGAGGRDGARRRSHAIRSGKPGYRILMSALAAKGERAEALRVWEQCRATLVEELGTDPSPETEAVYLAVLGSRLGKTADAADGSAGALPSGVVTFLLTDIVGSSTIWDEAPEAMAARDRPPRRTGGTGCVGARGGKMLKSKLEGDATVSVFARATAGAAAALDLLDSDRRRAVARGGESPSAHGAAHRRGGGTAGRLLRAGAQPGGAAAVAGRSRSGSALPGDGRARARPPACMTSRSPTSATVISAVCHAARTSTSSGAVRRREHAPAAPAQFEVPARPRALVAERTLRRP